MQAELEDIFTDDEQSNPEAENDQENESKTNKVYSKAQKESEAENSNSRVVEEKKNIEMMTLIDCLPKEV